MLFRSNRCILYLIRYFHGVITRLRRRSTEIPIRLLLSAIFITALRQEPQAKAVANGKYRIAAKHRILNKHRLVGYDTTFTIRA